GNLFATIGQPPVPYFNGRFSNGPVWTELLAGGFGSMNSPFQGTGVTGNVNLAFGGAQTGVLSPLNNTPTQPGAGFFPGATTPTINAPPGIASQIAAFAAFGGTIQADDTVTVWGGANNIFDFFDTVPGGDNDPTLPGFILPDQTTITTNSVIAATDMVNNVATLAGMGARTIVVPNLPNIGATPAFNGSATSAQGGFLASFTFNSALSQGLDALQAGLPAGTRILRIDTDAIFTKIISNGAAFGFTNVTDSCVATIACVTGSTATQNTFLFWDGVHPTAAAQVLFAQAVLATLNFADDAADIAALSESVMWARRDGVDSVIDRANGHVTGYGEKKRGGYFEMAGTYGKQDSRRGRSAYSYNTYGIRGGADVPLSDNLMIGGAIGVLLGNVGGGPVKAKQYNLQGDIYALVKSGNFFAKVAAGFGGGHLRSIKRQTALAGFVNEADTNSYQASFSGEAGSVFDAGSFKIVPSARLDYLRGTVTSFDESGALTPLSYSDLTSSALFGAVKVRAVTMLGNATAYGEVGYEQLLSYKFKGTAELANSPGTGTSINVADPAARGFFGKVGMSGKLTDTITVDVSYAVALQNSRGTTHAGKARIGMSF
ncbi:MAG TPA: autotransporter domain-containing protein, partial [Rhizobiales bacterium]|nr:autotransporter domain-containing protein [Hyphomicrobiales bacterium]